MAKLFQNCVLEIRQLHAGSVSDPKVPEIQHWATAPIRENRFTFSKGVNETRVWPVASVFGLPCKQTCWLHSCLNGAGFGKHPGSLKWGKSRQNMDLANKLCKAEWVWWESYSHASIRQVFHYAWSSGRGYSNVLKHYLPINSLREHKKDRNLVWTYIK